MLDDGFKCRIILEALARLIIIQKLGDSCKSIDDELDRISRLESEIALKIFYRNKVLEEINNIEIPFVELREVLWRYFSEASVEPMVACYSFKKIVRTMADILHKEPLYAASLEEKVARLKFEKIKKVRELEQLRGASSPVPIEVVPVPECFYNLSLSALNS